MTDAAGVVSAPAEAENIAVCIRVRPMNERETRAQDAPALSCVPALNAVALTDPATGAPLAGKGNTFQYDHIFEAGSDARDIYARVARRIVRSTLGGINGTIFAYGQTSSGKTFTMQGDGGMPFKPEAESARPGILQLAVEDIFGFIESCADRDFLLRVSFLEIYNEVVRDLLGPSDNLKLREDPRKGVYVECHEEIITNYEDIVTLLQTGNRNRTVGHTAMNDKSSRSHSVFRIVIESKHKGDAPGRRLSEEDVNGAVLVASLNLVDLAGSESLRHTGNEGIRQREAGNINKSLLTLARVINSLASAGGQNAPFRDSKLTRLLQNSLGGNTRTLIICCVTPSDRYIEETKSTLQFAARAKDIKTSATVNEVLDDQTQLRRLKREVNELKKLVNSEALNALKAENEALLSEKNHNKTEMARLKGLILSSSSVAKAAVDKKRAQRGKRTRETWGPGDFPASIKARAPLSPHRYPRKRRSPAKENLDPQTLFRVYEDADEDGENPASESAMSKFKPIQAGQSVSIKDGSKEVLDLFSAVLRNYRDENVEDPVAAIEAIANEKSASLGDIERARAFDVLADIRALMVASVRSRTVLDEKLVLEQELKKLRVKLNEGASECNCSENASKASALVEEMMAELGSTQEALAKEKQGYQDLETQAINSQQMAAEELDSLRYQLETLKLEVKESQQQFDSEKRELQAALESVQSGMTTSDDNEEYLAMHSRRDELEGMLEAMKASQTVLQLAVAERDDEIASLKSQLNDTNPSEQESRVKALEEEKSLLQQKISELEQQIASASESTSEDKQSDKTIVEKLAGELQNIMQELAQLQADHERTALEKQELQAESERVSEELEASQRQGYELSETLMQKEHVAKVLQAQLDAKLMTISQMQTKHSGEVEALKQTIQDLTAQREQLQTKIEGLSTAESIPTTAAETEATVEDASTNTDSNVEEAEEMEAQSLRSLVEQLTEKLSAVESELASAKERLQAPEKSPDQSDLQVAFDKLQADFDNVMQEREAELMALEEQKQDANSPPQMEEGSQQRFDALNEDVKRLADDLEKVSRERDDCVDELRALEAQLMEVSEEKMKLAMSADEQEIKLREVQQAASSSSETIATLQAQLEEAQSAKATLEASKDELVQTALRALQADHAAIVDELQQRDTVVSPGRDVDAPELEQLQQRLESESKQREKLELDVQSYEETLSVLRKEAKDSSATIADLLEKMKMLETDLESAARTQEAKDKELASVADALARSKEEQQEMRLQSKQRLVAAEGKEMALEEKISALEQQLRMSANGVSMPSDAMELVEAREKQTELQAKVTALENELTEAREELRRQDEGWNKKQAMAEREFARLIAEQKRLHEEIKTLYSSGEASKQDMEAQADELLKTKQSYAELSERKEAVQHELEAANAAWGEKQQELVLQMESMREQFQEAQSELEDYQQNADNEILRLRSVIEEANAEVQELKRVAKAKEEELEGQLGDREAWQVQAMNRQEALEAKCEELDDERRLLEEKCAALESQRDDVEQQLRNEILELSQKCATAQTQQAAYQGKLKEMETQLEITENDVGKYRKEYESLAESLKSSQVEAVEYHNQLVQAQLAQESMEQLVEKQKARIDKLEKVKMTTETLDLFRKLKKDRQDLQTKVQQLQKDLAQAEQALAQTQENHQENQQRLVENKDEELKLLKEHVEELRGALRAETQQAADMKAEMRAALSDEREKAEHEIHEMQALVKEKMELVERLEAQVASVQDAMVKLREQKSENVSYLEKENLDLHVEIRELKKQLESGPPEKDEVMGDTGTYDASAAAAARALGEDSDRHHESSAHVVSDGDDNEASSSQPQEDAGSTRAGGFLLSTTELDAIAAHSQEEPERPECSQQ